MSSKNWNISDILSESIIDESLNRGEVSIATLDAENRFFVGYDSAGHLVAIGPQLGACSALRDGGVVLEPDKQFEYRGISLERAYKVSFSIDTDTDFLVAVAIISGLKELNAELQGKVPADAIHKLIRTLRRGSHDTTEIGLFGELLTMLKHSSSDNLIAGWHLSAEDRFDFSNKNERVEVKTTLSPKRKHWFSDSQISEDDTYHLVVASLQIAIAPNGVTCLELRRQVERSIKVGLLEDFLRKCEAFEWAEFRTRFDLEGGLNSLRFFDAQALPVPQKLSTEILRMKWQTDLSLTAPMEIEKFEIFRPFQP